MVGLYFNPIGGRYSLICFLGFIGFRAAGSGDEVVVYKVRVMVNKQGRPPESILGENTIRLGHQPRLL